MDDGEDEDRYSCLCESLAGTSGFAGTGILSDRDDYFAECGSIHLQMYGLHDDGLILLARKTTHRQLHGGKNPPKGYRVSFWLGGIFNTVTLWLNKTIYKKHPLKRDYVLRFAEKERVFKDANKIIVASVSFSLLMFGIGIIITVLYLFMVR